MSEAVFKKNNDLVESRRMNSHQERLTPGPLADLFKKTCFHAKARTKASKR